SRCNNDIDLEPDELSRDFGVALAAPFRPAILDRDGAPFDPAKSAQALYKSSKGRGLNRRSGRAQVPNRRKPARLLCLRRNRPRRAAEKREKVAPANHSITSSARANSAGGMVRPRSVAVLSLMTSSYLVGACTGRSSGLAPRRIRST